MHTVDELSGDRPRLHRAAFKQSDHRADITEEGYDGAGSGRSVGPS